MPELHQEQAENPPRRDPDLLSDRLSQRRANGEGKERRTLAQLYRPKRRLKLFLLFKLVCEDVNVDRFFPVLYPKVRSSLVCV